MSEWKYVKRDGWPTTSGRYDLAWQDHFGVRKIASDVWIYAGDETDPWNRSYAWRERVIEEPPPLEPDGEES